MMELDTISSNVEHLVESLLSGKSRSTQVLGKNQSLQFHIQNVAPNIIEWISRPEFLNFLIEDEDSEDIRTIHHHWGQYQAVRDFFELLCPICQKPEDIECWGKSRESLESQPLLVWDSSYRDDTCPKCNSTRKELENAGLFTNFDTLLLIAGMRSAKSTTSGLVATYVEHKILTLENPQKLFGQAPNQLFEVSFIATTGRQAEKTVYESFVSLRENSPWVRNYTTTLKAIEKLEKRTLYEENKKLIKYNHINILFESLNSNSSGIAGGTRLNVFLDELARFDSTESKRSAQEIYRVSSQGLKTVRSAIKDRTTANCFGKLSITTSPISVNDYAMQLGKKSQNLQKIFYLHKSTWDFNPYQPKENFEEDFKIDPVGAQRDFGAVPPLATNPFIDDVDRFNSCVDQSLVPSATFLTSFSKDHFGNEYVGKNIQSCRIDRNYRRVIVGDAGKSNDSFALACAHGEWREFAGEQKWVTVFDWVVTVCPTINPKRVVSFDSAETLIKDITKKQRVEVVRFDQWNSESIVQSLKFEGIDADYLSIGTKTEYYLFFLREMYEGKVHLLSSLDADTGRDPYREMSDQGRAIHELLHLERSLDGKKIDHKPHEHNDLAVCIVGCCYLVQTLVGKNTVVSLTDKRNNAIGSIAKFRRW